MNYIVLLIVTLILNNLHGPFLDYSDEVINLVYDASQYSLFIFLFGFIFHITDKTNFKARAISLVLMFMFINLTLNTIYDKLDIALFYFQYPLGIALFSYLIYTTVKWNAEIKHTKIMPKKIYFVFKRPVSLLDYIVTMFKMPVSSFSIISNKHWYKFDRLSGHLCKHNVKDFDSMLYDLVEIGSVMYTLPLDNLVGIKWTIYKTNCITAFKPIFNMMNIKLGIFDFIPAVFAYKFFKGKYKCDK